MPRIAERRPAAEPSSAQQKERYVRILRAAARLGTERDLERVQMTDVAKEAEVAVATLYRYFPSKSHLFTTLMASQVHRLVEQLQPPGPGEDPVEKVAELFAAASRQLLSRPRLANAIIQSNSQATAATVPIALQTAGYIRDRILHTVGIDEPTPHDAALARLLVQCWFGSLTESLNGRITLDDVISDVRTAARLLLGDRSNAARPVGAVAG